jgi:hypothetical protein
MSPPSSGLKSKPSKKTSLKGSAYYLVYDVSFGLLFDREDTGDTSSEKYDKINLNFSKFRMILETYVSK